MIKKVIATWKKHSTRRARRKRIGIKTEDKNRQQFEYLARKGLRLPIYTL